MKIARRKFITGSVTAGAAGLFAPQLSGKQRSDPTAFPLAPLLPEVNSTPILKEAIQRAIVSGAQGVRLPGGKFHFMPEGATKRDLFISNNDDGENLIVVLLEGIEDFTIIGDETEMVFHGKVSPFVMLNCRDIQLEGFSIDWDVPFHCEGKIIEVSADGTRVMLEMTEESSFVVRDGVFFFAGEGFEQEHIKNLLEFDANLRETRSKVQDNFFNHQEGGERNQHYFATVRGERMLEVVVPRGLRTVPLVGNLMAIMPPERRASAIFASDTDGLSINAVRIHHSGAMGVIAQVCRDISISNSAVVPSRGRIVSTTVDATHFADCSGLVLIEDCEFSHHIDDAVNLHGTYMRISEVLGPDRVKIRYAHHQQYGLRNIKAGDLIAFSSGKSVDMFDSKKVTSVDYIDPQHAVVEVSGLLSDKIILEDAVHVLSRQADFVFQRNRAGKNRARAVIVKTSGMVLIEGNTFHTPGAAIRISGGVDHWHESGPVRHVVIRNNLFDHCNFGVWGKALIDIWTADEINDPDARPYHGLITIEQNEIRSHSEMLVFAYRAEKITFRNNLIKLEPYLDHDRPRRAVIETKAVAQLEHVPNRVIGEGNSPVEIQVNSPKHNRPAPLKAPQ